MMTVGPPDLCITSLCRRSGVSVTLVTRDDWSKAAELINILERAGRVWYPNGPRLHITDVTNAVETLSYNAY